MNGKGLFLLMIILLASAIAYAEVSGGKGLSTKGNIVELHLFHGRGCPHCAKEIKFLDGIRDKYPNLNINMHEVYFNATERDKFQRLAKAYGKNIEGVPTTFIDGKVFVGFSDRIANDIESEIKRCLADGCEDPIERIEAGSSSSNTQESTSTLGSTTEESTTTLRYVSGTSDKSDLQNDSGNTGLKISAIISAALVDAINPCAFAVLIILLSTILVSKSKKKALFAGFAFALSIFISYFLMGLGLYSAIEASGVSHIFYIVVSILAILIGLFNLKDYLWYGKWFVMEVPRSWRPKLRSFIKSVTSVPGAFLIGFLVSLFLLPCTSGPYIVILGLLAKASTRAEAIPLLFLYNLIFILPMILITLAIYFGFTTVEKAEEIRQKKLEILHLIAGIIILCLGIGMLIAMYLGAI